ncbi:MAG: hypothetical protein JO206_13315, partial [Solirubrobacterales bacterium]|nr:hypothetical protein [Solirubrobacterales bacterium]
MTGIKLRQSAPAGLVLAAAAATWLASGVGLEDVVLFLVHELGFALVPGCLLYAGLTRSAGCSLQLAAIGYALGSVLEVLVFALTAALHARGALWAYPPVAIAAGLLLLRVRARPTAPASTIVWGSRLSWTLAALCTAAIAYVAVAYFLFAPLPTRAGSVVYIPDLVFHLGVAAEALHHWPITDPKVAGVALPYENFIYMKLAATSQLTHIPLPTLLFRLYVLPLVVAIVALLACAGAKLSARRGIGIAAAALFLFVGQLGLDPHDPLVFANTVFLSLYDSPSYVLGVVVFLATLIVVHEQLGGAHARSAGSWVLLALLLVGCAGTKAAILPVLIGGLALFAASPPGRERGALLTLALTCAVFGATYWLIYHGESGGLQLHPPGSIRSMSAIQYGEARLAGSIGQPLFWLGGTIVGLIGFCGATLAGVPAALRTARIRRTAAASLLSKLLAASFVPFLLLTHKGASQNFFTYYGLAAGCILSAWGLAAVWDRTDRERAGSPGALSVLGAGWLGVLIAAAIVPYELATRPAIGPLYALWILLPAAVAVGLWLAAVRIGAKRHSLRAIAIASVVLVGVLDTPLHVGDAIVSRLRSSATLYVRDSGVAHGLTPGLQRALTWIRRHTAPSAVVAVNNQYSDPRRRSPDYYYYSAFGERRVFLEGWEDTIAAAGRRSPFPTPFPYRLALN